MIQYFIGIDSGASGGMAVLQLLQSGNTVLRYLMSFKKESPREVWRTLREFGNVTDSCGSVIQSTLAVLELQTPRGTTFFDKGAGHFKTTILRSTCVLYGDYLQHQGFLIASEIPFKEVVPSKWQSHHGMKKEKGEKDVEWKRRLKEKAQELFPSVKVTLQTADALLIASYAVELHKQLKWTMS